MLTTAGKTYMVTVSKPPKIGEATALYFIGSTLGSALGSVIGGAVLAKFDSFQLLGLVMLLGSAPLLMVVALCLPARAPVKDDLDQPHHETDSRRVNSNSLSASGRNASCFKIFSRKCYSQCSGFINNKRVSTCFSWINGCRTLWSSNCCRDWYNESYRANRCFKNIINEPL